MDFKTAKQTEKHLRRSQTIYNLIKSTERLNSGMKFLKHAFNSVITGLSRWHSTPECFSR